MRSMKCFRSFTRAGFRATACVVFDLRLLRLYRATNRNNASYVVIVWKTRRNVANAVLGLSHPITVLLYSKRVLAYSLYYCTFSF